MDPADVLLRHLLKEESQYNSRREMAERIGVHPSTLSNWLNKRQHPNPSLSELTYIAEELGLTLASLISEPEAKPTPRLGLPPKMQTALETGLQSVSARLLAASNEVTALVAALPSGEPSERG